MKEHNSSKKIISEKELRSLVLTRLGSLHNDVNMEPDSNTKYLAELKKTKEEKRRIIMDIYARYYSPQKTTDLSGLPKRQGDMTGEMLDFCAGFDQYIASMEAEYQAYSKQRKEAVQLLTMVLTLKQPFSRILYLRYYMKMSPEDACGTLHVARSTLFRKQNAALNKLMVMFANTNGLIVVPND